MVTGTNGPHDKRLAKQSKDIEDEIIPPQVNPYGKDEKELDETEEESE